MCKNNNRDVRCYSYHSYKMSSYEPSRTSAYFKDLRWRMVYQRLGMGLSLKMIGENLGVDQSTVHRAVDCF